ncbi:MAG TPA: anti-sigma factor [Rhodocyclaceae bacterium]|nr:anti-sigma factor [Rhodocyclaceae bacterium]
MATDNHRHGAVLEDDLHAFVDELLTDDRRKEVQDYLDRHPDAAALVARLRSQRQTLRNAFAHIADEPVPSRLNVQNIVDGRHSSAESVRRWKIAAAITLALGLGSTGGWFARGAAESPVAGVSALSREAGANYATYAFDTERPVEIDGNHKAQLVSWVSTRLQRHVPVPDLAQAGYRLVGGRLVATEHGPAALFLYDDHQGTRLAVMVRKMTVQPDTPTMQRNEGPFDGYSWADKGLGYSLVGNDRPASLHSLADEVRRQARLSL